MASLEDLARKEFPDLSEAEERLVRQAPSGNVANCIDLGGGDDPEKADGTPEAPNEKWPDTRNVRADLIRWLCVDRTVRELVDPRGLRIRGARIWGNLDLSFTDVLFPLRLNTCRLKHPMNLSGAKMPLLSLDGSWTDAITADGLELAGDIFLRNGFHADKEVRLVAAIIGGDLTATSGTFINLKSDTNPNSTGKALNADGVKVAGDIFVNDKFLAEGEVRLPGATIGGDLIAESGTFRSLNGNALSADRIQVTGGVFLRNGFSAEGTVRLPGATIRGNLDAEKGTFKQPSGNALFADGIKVSGDIFISNGFSAEGEVRLLGAVVGGNLEANGGTFKNPSGSSLSADGIKVSGDIFLKERFTAAGNVRLLGAEIAGQLEVHNAWLDKLNLDSAHITGPFSWQNVNRGRESQFPNKEWKPSLNLTDAKVGSLIDEAISWPDKGRLRLDGFVYDRITEGPTDATSRLEWLRLQPDRLGFRPQPYEQLITVLRRMGHEHQVAKVAIAKQNDLYEHGELGPWGKVSNRVLYHAVRYGHEPWRAFGWLAALVVAGTLMFLLARLPSVPLMVPSDKEAYKSDQQTETAKLPHYYPEFNAFVCSLDVILPFDLSQKSHWRLHERDSFDFMYWLFESYYLFQLFLGWVLLIVAAAVPAGLIKKD